MRILIRSKYRAPSIEKCGITTKLASYLILLIINHIVFTQLIYSKSPEITSVAIAKTVFLLPEAFVERRSLRVSERVSVVRVRVRQCATARCAGRCAWDTRKLADWKRTQGLSPPPTTGAGARVSLCVVSQCQQQLGQPNRAGLEMLQSLDLDARPPQSARD